jgi:hypothetical protein
MARPELVDDGLWELMKTLLPDHSPQQTEGAPESVIGQSVHGDCVCAGDGVPWLMVPWACLVNPFVLTARSFLCTVNV